MVSNLVSQQLRYPNISGSKIQTPSSYIQKWPISKHLLSNHEYQMYHYFLLIYTTFRVNIQGRDVVRGFKVTQCLRIAQ